MSQTALSERFAPLMLLHSGNCPSEQTPLSRFLIFILKTISGIHRSSNLNDDKDCFKQAPSNGAMTQRTSLVCVWLALVATHSLPSRARFSNGETRFH